MAAVGATARGGGRPGWPLQVYYAALAMLVIVVAAAAAVYVSAQSAADAQQAATDDAAFAARKVGAELTSTFKFIDSVTAPLVASKNTAALFSNPGGCTLGYAPVGPFSTGHIDLVRADGSVACTSSPPANAGSAYAGEPWLATSSPTVFAPLTDAVTGERVAVVAYPVIGVGVVAWFLDLVPAGPRLDAEFASGVNRLEFLITTPDGKTVIARSRDSAKWVGAGLAGTRFGTLDSADRTDLDGTPRWYAQSSSDTAHWRVYVGADKATALAGAARLQQRQLGIIGVGLIAVLLGMWLAYRQVAVPIAALTSAVRESRGSTSPAPVPVQGPAQVARLGEDINELITSLKREWTDRESAQRTYAQLFEGSPLPILVTDPATSRFLDVNEAAVKAFGYTHAEFLALDSQSLYLPTDDEERNEIEGLRSQIGPSYVKYGPLSFGKKDGSILRAVGTTYHVAYEGRPASVAMIEDVTEKEKLERQFQQAQRLESLGQLAGGVAHDFNNLLAVILNVTSQLRDRLASKNEDEWSESRRDLERVDKAAQSASRLTRQLLAFARREVVQGTVLSVSDQVLGLTELLRRTLGSHIVLKVDLPEVWPVMMDPGHLEQIVINLAVNGRDAMQKGGTLSIRAENITVDAEYASATPDLVPGRYVQLQVSDSGTGMDEATLEHIFEPFFTTKPVGHGTGLGLATVYGIVKLVQGHIGVNSELGHGTSVTVLIPATSQQLSAKIADAPLGGEAGTGTVLVVEDYADLRELIEEILKAAGYRVMSAPDGAAGLTLARAHRGEVDLLLTDIVMPNMLGTELARQLRMDHPGLRVLFMSGHAQPALGPGTAVPPGAVLLQKPFMADELLDKLHQALTAPAGGSVGIPQ